MEINPDTAGVITFTPLTKNGAPKPALVSHGLVVEYQEHDDGSMTVTHVHHYIVDNGVTDAYLGDTVRYARTNKRMLVTFTSVTDAPHLAKQFGRLYDTYEMSKSDCE